MKILVVPFLLSSLFTQTAMANAGCRGSFGEINKGLQLELTQKRGWQVEVRNQQGKLLYKTFFKKSEVSLNGLCDQSFQNSAGFSGRSDYCKSIFNLEFNTPDGKSYDFMCQGIFDRVH